MLDQMLFRLARGHHVVLGRMTILTTWIEECGKSTDLAKAPFKAQLVHDLDTALQIDLKAKERGETVTRLASPMKYIMPGPMLIPPSTARSLLEIASATRRCRTRRCRMRAQNSNSISTLPNTGDPPPTSPA
jgi:hypothetical protein